MKSFGCGLLLAALLMASVVAAQSAPQTASQPHYFGTGPADTLAR